jgi:ATP-dependent Clp protease protease subunit
VQVDDASADDIIAQLIVLESQDPDRDILMYINSPGGSFTAMTAIYDTMQYIRPDVQTFVIGQAASAAAVLLGAGAPGKRFALPNARVLIHQPALMGGDYGQASDLEIQAKEVLRMREWLEETWAKHSGRSVEQVRKDIERDKILSAAEAKEYGLIDEVLKTAQGLFRGLISRASCEGWRLMRCQPSGLARLSALSARRLRASAGPRPRPGGRNLDLQPESPRHGAAPRRR